MADYPEPQYCDSEKNDARVNVFVRKAQAHWRRHEFWQATGVCRDLLDYAEAEGFYSKDTGFADVSVGVAQAFMLVKGIAWEGYSIAIMERDLYVMFLLQIEACKKGDLRYAWEIGVYANINAPRDKWHESQRVKRDGWTDKFRAEIAEYISPELDKKFRDESEADWRVPAKLEARQAAGAAIIRIAKDAREKVPLNTWHYERLPLCMIEDLQRSPKGFSPELAEAMRTAAREAKEENINIDDPIEGDVGL